MKFKKIFFEKMETLTAEQEEEKIQALEEYRKFSLADKIEFIKSHLSGGSIFKDFELLKMLPVPDRKLTVDDYLTQNPGIDVVMFSQWVYCYYTIGSNYPKYEIGHVYRFYNQYAKPALILFLDYLARYQETYTESLFTRYEEFRNVFREEMLKIGDLQFFDNKVFNIAHRFKDVDQRLLEKYIKKIRLDQQYYFMYLSIYDYSGYTNVQKAQYWDFVQNNPHLFP